jgi:hypothetical protein
MFLANLHQGIDPFTSIDRFDRHQYTHLSRDVNHRSASRHARSRLPKSGAPDPFH